MKSVCLGHDDVEMDHVVLVDMGQQSGLVAVRRHVHHVTLLFQALLDEPRDFSVVYLDENFHPTERGSDGEVGLEPCMFSSDIYRRGKLQDDAPASPVAYDRPKVSTQ